MTRVAAVALALVLLAVARPVANGVSVRPVNTWTSDGRVTDAIAANGVVYLAGSFATLGPRTGAMAVLDRATGRPLAWPDFTAGAVKRILPDRDGGYIVQGTFREVNRQPAQGLVRLDATGALDPVFAWSRTEDITCAALAGDRLVISIGQVSALVDRRTGRVVAGPLPFRVHAGGTGPSGALVVWAAGPSGEWGLVQLSAATGAIERVIFAGASWHTVTAALVSGSEAFVATVQGQGVTGQVIRVDLVSGASAVLATVTGSFVGTRFWTVPVTDMLLHNGRLYLGGGLTHVNTTRVSLMAAIDASSGALTDWRAAFLGNFLAGDADRVIMSSASAPYGAPSNRGRPALFALDAQTGADTGWRVPLLADFRAADAVVVEPGRLVVGGQFAGVGVVERQGLAAITLPDGEPTAWQPQADADRRNGLVAASGSRVFVFESAGTPPNWVSRVTEYDAATGARAPWQAVTTGVVQRMVVSGPRLLIAGSFTAVDGVPRNGGASFDLTTSPPTLESWTPPLYLPDVTSLRVLPQAVLLGGAFPVTPSGPSYRAIALDPVTGAALPWLPVLATDPPGPYTSVDMSVTADRIFMAGFFDTINGQPRPRLAAFDLSGRLLPWRVDDASDVWPDTRLALFEERAYTTGWGNGLPGGVAFDLASGRRAEWTPIVDRSTTGGVFLPVAGIGLLRYALMNGAGSDGAYTFHVRLPSVSAVTGLRATVSSSTVTLSWDRADHAERYVIEAGTAPGLSNLATIDTGSPAITFTTTAPAGRYHLRVRGALEGDRGPASDDLVIVVGEGSCGGPPNVPGALQATTSGLSATITWQPPSGGEVVTQYAVDLVSGPGSPATLARVTGTAFSGSGPAGTYAVAVRAENACGTSAATPPVSVTLGSSMR